LHETRLKGEVKDYKEKPTFMQCLKKRVCEGSPFGGTIVVSCL